METTASGHQTRREDRLHRLHAANFGPNQTTDRTMTVRVTHRTPRTCIASPKICAAVM
jgi:hypothetical protein